MRAESAIVATAPLSAKEAAELARLENAIELAERGFHDTGTALARIHAKKLYRPKTWKTYLLERWDFGEDRAAQFMEAAAVMDDLKGAYVPPSNERQCRPLVGLSADQRRESWRLALEMAGKRRVSESIVAQAVAKVTGVPVGVEADGTISQDLAEILAKLSPEEQEVIIHACEERAQKQRRDDGGDEPAWLSDWKFARSQLKWWEKKGDPPAPVIKALELLNEVRGLLEQAEELRKKRAA